MKHNIARLAVIAAAAIGMALAAAPAAQAQAAFDYDDAMRLLEARGLEAEYNEPQEGATGPIIYSGFDGINFDLNFERCEEGGVSCNRLVLVAGFEVEDSVDIELINEWNAMNYGKAFLDDGDNPWLSLEINIESGLSRAAFGTTLDWWEGLLNDFMIEIGYEL